MGAEGRSGGEERRERRVAGEQDALRRRNNGRQSNRLNGRQEREKSTRLGTSFQSST